ncbi:MAG: hypothetical protein Q4F18_14505 [Clostridia bacterium]|nr:hypothetical protein [Clostridia bacterium]
MRAQGIRRMALSTWGRKGVRICAGAVGLMEKGCEARIDAENSKKGNGLAKHPDIIIKNRPEAKCF